MTAQAHQRVVPGGAFGTNDASATRPVSVDESRGRPSAASRGGGASSRAPQPAHRDDRLSAGWLMLLLPIACCGGPLVIGALATAGGLGWGALGAGAAVVLATAHVLLRRRAGRCCDPTPPATPSTAPHSTTNDGRS